MKRALLAILACLAVTGCGDMTKGKEAAESQVVTFHRQFNDEDLAAIVSAAHPDMFKGSSESEVTDFLGVVRSKLGKVTDAKTVGTVVRTVNGVMSAVLTLKVTFENGEGTETFTFLIENEKALLLGYNINSPDLIMK